MWCWLRLMSELQMSVPDEWLCLCYDFQTKWYSEKGFNCFKLVYWVSISVLFSVSFYLKSFVWIITAITTTHIFCYECVRVLFWSIEQSRGQNKGNGKLILTFYLFILLIAILVICLTFNRSLIRFHGSYQVVLGVKTNTF